MPRLQLTVFGGFQLQLPSGSALSLSSKKAQGLLAYLALPPGRAHLRDKLAALLWGDVASEQARTSLRQALFSIRKALGAAGASHLRVDGDTVALSGESMDVDAVAFARCVGEGTPAALERAAELYRGDLLEGFALDEPTFESWLLSERERLHELALDGLTRLLAHYRSAGATEPAVRSAIRLLALDPLQESTHRTLMELYARQGRRASALRQYQLCVAALQRELGVEPEAETRRLYQDLLRQRRAPAAPAPAPSLPASDATPVLRASAPVPDGPFVGRARELEQLRQAWAAAGRGQAHLVLVLGESGIGKTRLVEELAAELAAGPARILAGRAYPSEQILPFGPWVDALRGGRVIDDGDIVTRLNAARYGELARLFPELTPEAPPAATGAEDYLRLFEAIGELMAHLGAQAPVLLILEDLHWADEMTLRLVAFVTRRVSGPVLVVATAREEALPDAPALRWLTLELDREGRFSALHVPPLSRAETMAMVRGRSRRGDPEPKLARVAERVWTASEGNPFMAIEMLRAIEETDASAASTAMPLSRRIREVITDRLDRLRPSGRDLVAAAAVIGREFEFVLLQRASRLDEGAATEALEELVRRRIVREDGERFELAHEWMRDVAYGNLLPSHRARLHGCTAEALEALYADDLARHYPALAVHWREAGVWPKAVDYLCRVAEQARRRHALLDAVAALREALLHAQRLPVAVRGRAVVDLVLHQVSHLSFLGRFTEALDLLDRHHQDVEHLDERALAARYHLQVGRVASFLGHRERAGESLERASCEARRCQDRETEGTAFSEKALEAVWSGRFKDGIEHARRAIALLETSAGPHRLGNAYFHLAINWYHLGLFDRALEASAAVEVLGEKAGDRRLVTCAAWSRGISHGTRGDTAAGIAACERAVELAPDPLNAAVAAGFLGYVRLEEGDVARAIPLLEGAVRRLGQFRYGQFEGLFTLLLADAARLGGRLDTARALASRGLEITAEAHYDYGVAWAQRSMGLIDAAEHDGTAARRRLHEALTRFEAIDARFEAARTRLELAERAEAPHLAAEHLGAARRAFAELGAPRYEERLARLGDSPGRAIPGRPPAAAAPETAGAPTDASNLDAFTVL